MLLTHSTIDNRLLNGSCGEVIKLQSNLLSVASFLVGNSIIVIAMVFIDINQVTDFDRILILVIV